MIDPPKTLADVLQTDRVVHEPVRLCILCLMANVEAADFVYLQKTLNLTGGNLSTHLSKLVDAGLVRIEKGFSDNRPRTTAALTKAGRDALERHASAMVRLLGEFAR